MRLLFLAVLSAAIQSSVPVALAACTRRKTTTKSSSTSSIQTSASSAKATPTTWYSTSFVKDEYATLHIVKYGTAGVTPVPTSSLPEVIEQTVLTEPTASRNINQTILVTKTITRPLTTETIFVPITTPLPPPSTHVEGTTTSYLWTSHTIATVTLTQTASVCVNTPAASTVTKYTGKYTPLPGQKTTSRTRFPTALIEELQETVTYRVYPYTGSTVTYTDTETSFTYLSTKTTTVTQLTAGGRYTSTIYASTETATRTEYQLAYSTVTVTPSRLSCKQTVTITQAAKCAPTNLLSEQDNLGVAIRILPNEWSFPIGFPDTVLGIPGGTFNPLIRDASSCCQLCVDNPGCAASEWAVETNTTGSCRVYWFNSPPPGEGNIDDHGIDGGVFKSGVTSSGSAVGNLTIGGIGPVNWKRDTCGRPVNGAGISGNGDGEIVALQYFANSFALPGQGSYIQVGCGRLVYIGEMDPWF